MLVLINQEVALARMESCIDDDGRKRKMFEKLWQILLPNM